MTVFFNLQTLEEQAGSDSIKFLTLLEYHYTKKLATRYSKYKPSRVSLTGFSYLLNPVDFFQDNITDILYKVQYIKLAARRDYNLYKQYAYKGLQISFYPDLKIERIKQNPLLNITQQEILFKFEEYKNGTSIHTN